MGYRKKGLLQIKESEKKYKILLAILYFKVKTAMQLLFFTERERTPVPL